MADLGPHPGGLECLRAEHESEEPRPVERGLKFAAGGKRAGVKDFLIEPRGRSIRPL